MSDSNKDEQFRQLRKLAEDMLHQGDAIAESLPVDLAKLTHELEVHQIELEMQHTELARAYDSLEYSQQQYADLFNFAPVGYIVTDREGIIQQANRTIADMLGIDRAELIEQKFNEYVSREDKDIYYMHQRAVFRTGNRQSCDLRMICADNTEFFVQLNTEPVADEFDICRTSVTDTSKIKKAEEALREALHREKELNNLKSQLIEMISHELRTPLTTILTAVDVLERYESRMAKAKKKQRYDQIRTYVWYLNDVINDVIVAHRSNDAIPKLRVETFDVTEFLEKIIYDMDVVTDAHKRIQYDPEANQSPELASWDKHLFQRIVTNLIQNALKYSDAAVNCSLHCNDHSITLEVQDHGNGIPADDRPYIFDMFYRGSNTVSVPGTGVGLGIVQTAVKAHQGVIRFDTNQDGTTFVVRLPRHAKAKQ